MVKYRKKSQYGLFAPYMDQIAPYLVKRLCLQPAALTEGCRFLTIAPQEFLNVTLNHTLPHIFADRDRQCLDAISLATHKKCHVLFFAYPSKILARAFMASKLGQTSAVLTFITAVLAEAAGNGAIDIGSVVKSYLVNLRGRKGARFVYCQHLLVRQIPGCSALDVEADGVRPQRPGYERQQRKPRR